MSEFTDYLSDVFILFGRISARRMFGGHGIYLDDCMFGLVADDTLYLKADQQNIHHFQALELPPFEYEKSDGRKMAMSFYLAPETIYEDQEDAATWAAHAWEAAKRAKSGKKKVSKKKVNGKKASGKKSVNKKPGSNKASSKKASSKKVSKKKSGNMDIGIKDIGSKH